MQYWSQARSKSTVDFHLARLRLGRVVACDQFTQRLVRLIQRAAAAATEFCAGRIGGGAIGADHFDGPRWVPRDRCAAHRRAATSAKFCAGRLVHTAARTALGTISDWFSKTWIRRSRHRSSRVHRSFRSHHIKVRVAATYGRAISDDGSRVVYSAETATNTTQV